MKLIHLAVITSLALSVSFAGDFISYKELAAKLVKENKKNGLFATTEEVKKALTSKDTLVVDVRTKEEWSAAHIKGSVRVGREAPEKALANFVLDDDDKFVKPNLIVLCNSAKRASIEAETFRKMGFKSVKVYAIYNWLDECNPVVNKYTKHKNKSGKNKEYGYFYSDLCKNKK